jgi:YtcA family
MTSRLASGVALVVSSAACNPLVNLEGSFFPAWMLCLVLGVALTAAARYLFVLVGLEPHLGPPPLIYTSLALLLSVLTWIVIYRS